VSKELFIVHTEMDVDWPSLKSILLNGFKSAFLPFHERRAMLRTVAIELEQFEREHNLLSPAESHSPKLHPTPSTLS